ncbi:MAG: histidine--tRNA ligase [Bacteroidales bacterium]|nr:histidine--tRNA ligase [Bacteroidales bacterium]
MAVQVSIPKGTRDFATTEMSKRNYIFDNIKTVFEKYAYQAIETPAMENLSTLLGKYGEEGDRLIFKILNSGNYLNKIDEEKLKHENISDITNLITEKGLRYDLTVPFARFIVQNRSKITFPFKRYQIQPVWRADKPQKGRYREFFQCDVDVIGSNSLFNEFELIQIIDEIFEILNLKVTIKINNRKILAGIAETIGELDKFIPITVAIDKFEKIGLEKVNQELQKNGLSAEAITKLQPVLSIKRNPKESIEFLSEMLKTSKTGLAGLEEIKTIFDYLKHFKPIANVELDLSLARGLNYYTGAIFEVTSDEVELGSICGGGRYDDLTSIFGMKDISGVGVSFGADRIYDVLNQLNRFPNETEKSSDVFFINFGKTEELKCIQIANEIRKSGYSCEIYPQKAKIDKQFKYANNKNIQFVIIIGAQELENNTLTIKDMSSGDQTSIKSSEIIDYLEKVYFTKK